MNLRLIIVLFLQMNFVYLLRNYRWTYITHSNFVYKSSRYLHICWLCWFIHHITFKKRSRLLFVLLTFRCRPLMSSFFLCRLTTKYKPPKGRTFWNSVRVNNEFVHCAWWRKFLKCDGLLWKCLIGFSSVLEF